MSALSPTRRAARPRGEPERAAGPRQGDGVDRRGMAVLSAGHLFTDMSQGAVPALLPFLIASHGLSIAAASALIPAATISSSVIQPVFGHFSDRRSLPGLMPAGVLLGGVGIGLAGVASSYALTFLAIVLSGLGVAAFHPEGSRFANYVSGARRASGMSLFSVGGNAGFALGAGLVAAVVVPLGLSGTLILIAPAGLMALVLAVELRRLRTFRPDAARVRAARAESHEAWGPFARLGGVVAFRSLIYFGLLSFVPLYFIHELHTSKAAGDAALTIMLLGGAVGTLIGGPLADRVGRRTVLLGSMALLCPLIVGFLLSGRALATVLVALIGAVTIATFSVTVVMGQEYLPGRIGVASGVTLGLSIGLGGVGAPLFGLIADAHGLTAAVAVIGALPLLGLVLAGTLPRRAPEASPA